MYRSLAAEIFLTPSGVAASCREANQSLVSRASSARRCSARELEDVGWLVPEVAFAPQPLSHRGDVGSRSTNHRDLVFVQRQPGAVTCRHDHVARGGVTDRFRRRRRRQRGGEAANRIEHRSPLAPGGYPFVGVSGPQYRRFIEGAANDLRRERQTLRREAYALGERRAASDIEWRH